MSARSPWRFAVAGAVMLAACSVRMHSQAGEAGDLACDESTQCPAPEGLCLASMCLDGECVFVPAPQGALPLQDQRAGDCQQTYCDGNGQVASYASPADVPAEDSNRCTEAACQDGAPAQLPRPAGALCGEAEICTGTGFCGVCLPEQQRCDGHALAACNPRGQWQQTRACSGSQPVCRGARCVGVAQLSAGHAHVCARFEDDSVRCWGADQVGWSRAVAASSGWAASYQQLAVGAGHACALAQDGAVWCWGRNDYGQLGAGHFDAIAGPQRVALAPAQQLAVGREHSCALLRDGSVWCWGRTDRGQLAVPSAGKGPAPLTPAPLLGSAVRSPLLHDTLVAGGAIAAPGADLCVRQAGRLACLGKLPSYPAADFPPAADPDDDSVRNKAIEERKKVARTEAAKLAGVTAAEQIGCGDDHCCARLAAGTVLCWGAADKGQLGVAGPDRASVAPVPDIADARQLVVGANFSCVAHADGAVSCWGDNSRGQLGRAAAAGVAPGRLSGVAGVTQLVAGREFACVLSSGGSVQCWGDNAWGQSSGAAGALTQQPTAAVW